MLSDQLQTTTSILGKVKMKKQATLLIVASALLISSLIFQFNSTNAQDPKPKLPQNVFDGKIVTIYTTGKKMRTGAILVNAELKEIGGRMMLVGAGADTGDDDNWTAGVQIGVAWDSVSTYYAMTPEQYEIKLKERAK